MNLPVSVDARPQPGDHARPRRGRARPRARQSGRLVAGERNSFCGTYGVFREGAENSARGGRAPRNAAFSLIEILLVTALLTLIMLALMAVFNSTQTAFRASITQTDVLEGSRSAMDIIASDFRQMTPSSGLVATLVSPALPPGMLNQPSAPVNFWLSAPQVTYNQSLIGVSSGQLRTNQVQSFFILSYENQTWKGVGYFVDTNSTDFINPLYRYDSSVLPGRPSPRQIFTNFLSVFNPTYQTISETNIYIHHLLDGVVHLNVRAYDTNGFVLTNGYTFGQQVLVKNTLFYVPSGGEVPMMMSSNTLPATVEIQMAVLEDRSLRRAESMLMGSLTQSNYLSQQVGKVHLFRQRVTIPNADPSAYR